MSFRQAAALSLVALVAACSAKSSNTKSSDPEAATETPCGIGLAISAKARVAVIDGVEVACSELMARSKAAVQSATTEFDKRIRDIHEANLAALISDHVLQVAADEAGLPITEFIAANVTVEPTTIDEMHAFYDQAIAEGQKLPAFEEVQNELINFMTEQKQKAALLEFRAGLRSKAKIELDLPILETGGGKPPSVSPSLPIAK